MSLNKQIAKGAAWMIALKTSVKAIGFVSTLFLARLLSPEDFGLLAIIMAFFALIDIFGNFSFDTVLIQNREATSAHYNTAWTFNVAFGVFASLVVCACAGVLAKFYGDPRIESIMVALSILFLMTGFQNIGVVDFRKNLTFEKEFRFQLIPKIISFFFTIALAFWLRNYWALVIGSLIWKGLILLNSYILHPYRPRFTFSESRHLFRFSKWLMINNIFYFLNNRSAEMIVGKILSPQAAGFFMIAQEIASLPTSELVGNVNTATYPGYCKVAHSLDSLKAMYLTVMESIALMVLPAGIGIATLAHLVVPVILGSKWGESIGLIQYLALAGSLIALNTNTGFVFLAMGKPKVPTFMGLLRVVFLVPSIVFLSHSLGLEGVALAVLLTAGGMFFCFTALSYFGLKLTIFQIICIYVRPLFASCIMAAFIVWLSPKFEYWFVNSLALMMLISIGVVIYIFSILLLWFLFRFPDGVEQRIFTLMKTKFG